MTFPDFSGHFLPRSSGKLRKGPLFRASFINFGSIRAVIMFCTSMERSQLAELNFEVLEFLPSLKITQFWKKAQKEANLQFSSHL